MHQPPKEAFKPGTFGRRDATTIPLPALRRTYPTHAIHAAWLNSRIIQALNTHLGSQRTSLRTWCHTSSQSYRRWGKLTNGDTWLNITDITTLMTTDPHLSRYLTTTITTTHDNIHDIDLTFGRHIPPMPPQCP